MQDPPLELGLFVTTIMDLQTHTTSWLESNFSESGSGFSGSGNGSGDSGSFVLFNCRTSELSRTSITSQFYWSVLPNLQYASPYVATVEAIFFVIAFFWNLFILGCFIRRPHLLKEPAHIYLLNLAITDVLHSVFIILITCISEAEQEFIFGSSDFVRCHFCEFLGFMLLFLVTSSLHTLAALSVDRFVLLARPLRYKRYFNWKRAIFIVVLIWVISFWVAIPPVLGFGQYEFNLAFANCHARWTGSTNGIEHINYIIFAGVEAVIPFLLLVFFNALTYKIVTRFLRKRLARQRSFRDTSNMDQTERQKERDNTREYTKKQRQLMKVFGGLLLAHICSWCPTLIMSVVGNIVDPRKIPLEVFLFVWITYISNPVIHPIIETFFVKDLRYRLKKAHKNVKGSLRRVGSFGHSIISRTTSLNRFPSFRSSLPPTPSSEKTSFSKRFSKLSIPDTPVSPDSGIAITPVYQMQMGGSPKEWNEQENKVSSSQNGPDSLRAHVNTGVDNKDNTAENSPSSTPHNESETSENIDSPETVFLSSAPRVTFREPSAETRTTANGHTEHQLTNHPPSNGTRPSCLKKDSTSTEENEMIERLQTILVTPV